MGVEGLGFRVQGSGLRVQGSGFRVQALGFRVENSGFRAQGSECEGWRQFPAEATCGEKQNMEVSMKSI